MKELMLELIAAGKRYLVCSVRNSTQQDFRAIQLDLAD